MTSEPLATSRTPLTAVPAPSPQTSPTLSALQKQGRTVRRRRSALADGAQTTASGKAEKATPCAGDVPQASHQHCVIHPIITYPFRHPKEVTHLEALYGTLIRKLADSPDTYAKPITVLNQQTSRWNEDNTEFKRVKEEYVARYSDIIDVWSVDTCQMWLHGFGHAFGRSESISDVYWLIPGDFYYASTVGRQVLDSLEKLPCRVARGECELCLGEIKVPLNSSKQLIDTYGTYGLLYNWFPAQAQGIRLITDKPRTEFFAINHSYLKFVLDRRWYAYEQTIVILLHGMQGNRPAREIRMQPLGEIEDDPEGRASLASAMQQVERTERVLKVYWRELNEPMNPTWPDVFRKLDAQSEQIRGAALVILEQILR